MSMTALFWIPVVWFAGSVAFLVVFHRGTLLALWREPMLAWPVVIVESDDWGSGPPGDAARLEEIIRLLGRVRDRTGHPAVMTIGVVLGQPDGASILASDCEEYCRKTMVEPEFAAIVGALKDGCQSGVFALQRHGIEHCWPASLVSRARTDESLRAWLGNPASRSEALPSELQSRWVDTSTLPSRKLSKAEIGEAIAEERALLETIFGGAPKVAVPNTFVWDDEVEQAWFDNGVTGIVTPGRRYEGRDSKGRLTAPTRIMRNGDRSRAGAVYIVRDEYFEPVRGHRAERAWGAVEAKTAQGRPTLLETHRESFVVSGSDAERALAELERFLEGVLVRYPDVRFMSVETLLDQLGDPNASIRLRPLFCRISVFLSRLQHEASLAKFLRVSGCKAVIVVAKRILSSVTRCPVSQAA